MRKALGKGLDALLPKNPPNPQNPPVGAVPTQPPAPKLDSSKILISSIRPNRLQPRKNFDPERLSELAQSIKEHGLAQPIVVSRDPSGNTYELIAGERRLRASQLAGLTTIEAVIREPGTDKQRLALALIENIQRDNLNAIETALAYKKLMQDYEIPQIQLSQVVGKSKSAISNTLRLLDLPEDIQKAVQFEQISEGHARALLMVSDALARRKLFHLILEQHLSVRDVENRARQIEEGHQRPDQAVERPPKIKSADVKAMEQLLQQSLGTKVEINTRKDGKSGRMVLYFYSLSDFDNIVKVLKK